MGAESADLSYTARAMATSWRCPVPDCAGGPDGSPWQVTESAAMVEALVISYARTRHGELPDAVQLANLRLARVAGTLDEHLRSHPADQVEAWLARISQPG